MKKYLNLAGFAERLGMSAGYVRQLRMQGKLPKPDVVVGEAPGWSEKSVDAWAAKRGVDTKP